MSTEWKTRKEDRRNLARQISAMSAEDRHALAEKINITTIEGHQISEFNRVFIHQQGGVDVTVIGGYRQWKEHGRHVRKGEVSYAIWCPSKRKQEQDKQEDDSIFFFLGSVFDVSQTDENEEVSNPGKKETEEMAIEPQVVESVSRETALVPYVHRNVEVF